MKLRYTKISKDVIKFFYEDEKNGYGEFYVRFKDLDKVSGEAELEHKDFDYSQSLLKGMVEALARPAPNYEE